VGFYYDILNLSVNLHSSIYCCSYFKRYDEAFQMQKINSTIEEIKPLYKRLIPLIWFGIKPPKRVNLFQDVACCPNGRAMPVVPFDLPT